jgi:MFS family permease
MSVAVSNPEVPAFAKPSPRPSPAVAWLTIAVLFIYSVFAMVDRQIMTMLVDPIRRDLGISDVQASLLLGFSFAIFYTTIGLVMGWIADRTSRRALIGVSVALWGLASAACGLASNFSELFIARMLVGVGEAALGPAAYSMISDSFPRHRLSLAMSVFIMGGLVGGAIAILAGGFVVAWSTSQASVWLPIIGELHSWRLVFFVTGLPGPFLALLAFLFPEPARLGRTSAPEAGSTAHLVRFLKANAALLALLCIAFGALSMIVNSTFAWSPTVLGRTLHVAPVHIGITIAALLIFAGLPGQIATGWWVDRQAAKGDTTINLRIFLFTLPFAVPAAIIGLLWGDVAVFAVGMIPHYFFAMTFLGVAAAALQLITPNELRGRVSALFTMLITLIGFGIGPTLVALLSTSIDASGMAIGKALAVVLGCAATVALVALALALPRFRDALQADRLSRQQ